MQISSELKALEPFLLKLADQQQNRHGNLRIADFGDSIVEADLITSQLRHKLQESYGGSGVGMVPITSMVNQYRETIVHSFSRNWETLSFMKRGTENIPLGIIGYSFIPRTYYYEESVIETKSKPEIRDSLGNVVSGAKQAQKSKQTRRFSHSGPAWVEYGGIDKPGGAPDFKRIRLFYSHASASSQLRVAYDGGDFSTRQLESGEQVRVLDLSPASPVTKIRLEFSPTDPIHVYGVSFDDSTGVYVDNFSVRGFSGMYFSGLSRENLAAFNSHLDYDLVVLQYGGNVSSPTTTDYSYFTKGLKTSIDLLREALGNVPILIVSAPDHSIKVNGQFQTAPDIPILVNAQGEFARETGAAFWNLFEAMGGLNSMPGYVNAQPPLAWKDYLHFTKDGANHVGEMVFKVISTGKN